MKPYRVEETVEGISIRDANGRVVVNAYWYAFSSRAKNLEDVKDGVGFGRDNVEDARRGVARQASEFAAMCEGLNAKG